MSVMKNILAEATITEELPKDFGIYDLGQFLNGMGLHQSPELDFGKSDSYVVIREGKSRSGLLCNASPLRNCPKS